MAPSTVRMRPTGELVNVIGIVTALKFAVTEFAEFIRMVPEGEVPVRLPLNPVKVYPGLGEAVTDADRPLVYQVPLTGAIAPPFEGFEAVVN